MNVLHRKNTWGFSLWSSLQNEEIMGFSLCTIDKINPIYYFFKYLLVRVLFRGPMLPTIRLRVNKATVSF